MRERTFRHPARATAVAAVAIAAVTTVTAPAIAEPASAATVGTAYVAGHRDVTINDYGTAGLGAFEFDTGTERRLAWCIEAHVAHTTRPDAYRLVPSSTPSPELDTLVWILERSAPLDDDTATAGAALAWWYTNARRTIGPPVWSDGSDGFAPVDPFSPYDWTTLPPITATQPIGLRSGSTDLDAAERRVVELHRAVTAWSGPWDVHHDGADRIAVRGANGPISGVEVAMTVRMAGLPDFVVTATTGPDGSVTLPSDLLDHPGLVDHLGGEIVATVAAPGPHQEWDGDGDTQRMVTATTVVREAVIGLDAPRRHIEIAKVSSDPTIAPGGATFEIRDGGDAIVEVVRTDPSGSARVAPIDPGVHPPPYRIIEIEAPVGLAVTDPIDLADASTDGDAPTVVRVVNSPLLATVVVRKRLSVPVAGPSDRSGFVFDVTRRADGSVQRTTTGPDGSTPSIALALGDYQICETGSPPWADRLVDGGCRPLIVTSDDVARTAPITVEYTNIVPEPAIDTRVADPADGDRTLPPSGGTLVDHVVLDGTVPGTRYRLTGTIVADTGATTDITSVVEFAAVDHRTELDLTFDVGPIAPGAYVVIEHLDIVAVDEVVRIAEHTDLDDSDQTFRIVESNPGSNDEAISLVAPTLPTTGAGSDMLRRALGVADATFVLGTAFAVIAGVRRVRRT